MNEEKEKISLNSYRRWLWMGLVVALISPIAGIVVAAVFWTEPKLKKQSKIIFILSIIWGIAYFILYRQGYLLFYR